MSLYTLRRRQTILASTHGHRANRAVTTAVGAVEYMIQAPISAARAMMPSAPIVTPVEAPLAAAVSMPSYALNQATTRPIDAAGVSSDAFSQQFPAINAVGGQLGQNILNELNSYLSTFVRSRGANAEEMSIWLQQTNLLRKAGWYDEIGEAFKNRSPMLAAKVLSEIKALASRVHSSSRTPVGNGFESYDGPMPRGVGSVGPMSNTPMADQVKIDTSPQYTIAAPYFNRQFKAISALSEPRRSEMLNRLDSILYDYLTKLGTIAGASAGYGRMTHTWRAWANWLFVWKNYKLTQRGVAVADVTPAALAEIAEVERKLRAVNDNGMMKWIGPWPRNFGECRASYNEYIRATGWEGKLPPFTDCSVYTVTPAAPKYTAVAGSRNGPTFGWGSDLWPTTFGQAGLIRQRFGTRVGQPSSSDQGNPPGDPNQPHGNPPGNPNQPYGSPPGTPRTPPSSDTSFHAAPKSDGLIDRPTWDRGWQPSFALGAAAAVEPRYAYEAPARPTFNYKPNNEEYDNGCRFGYADGKNNFVDGGRGISKRNLSAMSEDFKKGYANCFKNGQYELGFQRGKHKCNSLPRSKYTYWGESMITFDTDGDLRTEEALRGFSDGAKNSGCWYSGDKKVWVVSALSPR